MIAGLTFEEIVNTTDWDGKAEKRLIKSRQSDDKSRQSDDALTNDSRADAQSKMRTLLRQLACASALAAGTITAPAVYPGYHLAKVLAPYGSPFVREIGDVSGLSLAGFWGSDTSAASSDYVYTGFVKNIKIAFAQASLLAAEEEADGAVLEDALAALFRINPVGAAESIHIYARQSGLPSLAYYEILVRIGEMDDDVSHDARFKFLSNLLRSDDPVIRSGAAAGLVALDDKRGALLMRRAAEREGVRLLRLQLIEGAGRLEASIRRTA